VKAGTRSNRSLEVTVVDPASAARRLALETAREMEAARAAGRRFVMALAAGSSPLGLYAELVRLHRAGDLDASHLVAFNLDEYLELGRNRDRSFGRWMHEHILGRINVEPEHVHAPPDDLRRADVGAFARDYEHRIRAAGGLDLAILGIGRNGHLAFNEPGSARDSRTREVELDGVTRADAAAAFGTLERVPRRAVTLGIADILAARRILVLAFGESKRDCVRAALHGEIGPGMPASFLREHPNARLFVDALAMGSA
jgi:glucosamine-6-phosphate deaminase